MGFSRKRVGGTGTVSWIALYRDARGKVRSAGTHPSEKIADKAWQHAEALLATGHPGDRRAGRIKFADYVSVHWFPHHILEPTTRESYRYNLQRHITPWFGPMRMADILPIHVREWVTELVSQGVSPATIRHQKIILSAIFTTALNDYVVTLHPCKASKTRPSRSRNTASSNPTKSPDSFWPCPTTPRDSLSKPLSARACAGVSSLNCDRLTCT
jgi:Phage integrase, N-terminal SAM-like domain